ncbi:GpE family phage tail protein [Novosphingobium sp. 11B]
MAYILHWPKSELETLDLDELMEWRNRAVAIWNRMNPPKDGTP